MTPEQTAPPTLAAALVAALSELVSVTKGRSARIETKGGGSYSYDYADLGDLIMDTRPVLAAHGLVALTPVHGHEGRLACTVELIHESGESKTFAPLPFPEGRDAQSSGSWMTYFRRYALLAALGMATTDDDGAGTIAVIRTAPAPAPPRFDPNAEDTWPDPLTDTQAKRILLAAAGDDKALASRAWDIAPPDDRNDPAWLAVELDTLIESATDAANEPAVVAPSDLEGTPE